MAETEPKEKIKRSLFRKIINTFIGFFAFIFLLLVIFLGYSQTSTFREFLRHKIIDAADSSLNGKINIEKIDGTIFTSLLLRNTSIILDDDTLFNADKIEIKTSPLQLLLKKIYFRKILLENVNIVLLQDSTGAWNFSKLTKQKEADTTKSQFDFNIQAADLQLRNINFTRQTFENKNSTKVYQLVNPEDLRIKNLYLSAELYADINNSNYLLDLRELSFHPNLKRFALQELSGQFVFTSDYALVKKFNMVTDSSFISIDARLDSLNLFGGVELKDFQKYPISIDLTAAPFNFNDLSSFLESTDFLKGIPDLQLKAKGKFGDFQVEKLKLDYYETHFQITGRIQNLNIPERLFINAQIQNSDIDYKDVHTLLPTLNLPRFDSLKVRNVNAEFSGEPTNFKAKLIAKVDGGKINTEAALNLKPRLMVYNVKFNTENLDLLPIIGYKSKINSAGTIAGKGTNPVNLNSSLKFTVENSLFNGHKIDRLDISSEAKNKIIDIRFDGKSETNTISLEGKLLYDADTTATYNFTGQIKNLNLADYLSGQKYESGLNFSFKAEGKGFNPDKMNASFLLSVDSSSFENHAIDYSQIKLDINNDSTNKKINLTSDFIDFNIFGNFSMKDAVPLLKYESETITHIISQKLEELNPIIILRESTPSRKDTTHIKTEVYNMPDIAKKNLKFGFDFRFKDLHLISMLLNNKLDIVGSGNGSVENSGNNFSFNTEISLDYLIFMNKQKTIYVSGLDADLNFTRDNRYLSFDKIFGTSSVTAKRFYSDRNIKDVEADVVFNQSKLFFNTSAEIDSTFSLAAEGNLLLSPVEQVINLDNLMIDFNGVTWTNKENAKIFFTTDYLRFENFALQNGSTTASITGKILGDNFQNLTLTIDNITGSILSSYLTQNENSGLSTKGSLTASIKGTYENPLFDIDMELKDITYSGINFGSLIGKVDYANKIVSTDIRFLDTTYNYNEPKLNIYGTIPIDLSFQRVEKRISDNDKIDLNLKSKNFDLSTFGNVLPYVINQKGKLIADVKIEGTLSNPVYSGVLGIQNGSFRSLNNYLDYSFAIRLLFNGQTLTVDSLQIVNAVSAKYGGKINGQGEIVLKGFDIDKVDIRLNGTLSVLSQESKTVSPLLYGDLLIGTDGDWKFQLLNERAYFTGNVLLKYVNLVYTTTDEQTYRNNTNFDIRIIEDTTKVDKELLRFQNVLKSEQSLKKTKRIKSTSESIFDYDMNIKVENSAKIVFILSQAANQRLTVEMDGKLEMQSLNGLKRAQGSFELLQGSKLEFFKTFDATGYLRFESDIYNPYLNVVATYTSEYVNPRDPTATPQEVAVKIKIKGPLEDLGKNLASNPGSIGIYVGSDNIQRNIPDQRYDYSDAFSFILIGKFKDDLTAQDKALVAGQTDAIGNTATSFLGSILTNFVNSAVGDLVNNISFTQSGAYTKFTLSGRIQNLRYSFGGTSELFQNFAKANIKIEYLFNPHFLIRLERRDPVSQSNATDEKTNELGFKYRFEF